MTAPRRITVLGATGSIGDSTLNVIAQHPQQFKVTALTGHNNVDKLAALARQWQPELVVIADPARYAALKQQLDGSGIALAAGEEGLKEAAALPSDILVNAIVGFAGLAPMLTAIERGATIALANKEALVCAGELVKQQAKAHDAAILPVDSEHNAIFQALQPQHRPHVEKLTLTASGGPFRGRSTPQLSVVTPESALQHPNWEMGRKITIDSATLMNKGLELIEACHLFDLPPEQVDIVVHPQSVIHSLVHFTDGSVLAQLGAPDMRIPIAYCLGWPERLATDSPRLDLTTLAQLDFEAPDYRAFPAPLLCREAMRLGGNAAAILNAANEIAVEAFLDKQIAFMQITALVEKTLSDLPVKPVQSLGDVAEADAAAREYTRSRIAHAELARRSA